MSYEAFAEAIKIANTQEAFARAVGASQQRISYLITRKKSLPAEFVLKAEAATGVSRHRLRPDIYPVETIRHEDHVADAADTVVSNSGSVFGRAVRS